MIINKEKGFALIEIAIVMVIIGILMGGGVSIFRVLNERKTRNNTIDYLKEVKEALITYADIKGYLPYPDTDSDGLPGPLLVTRHLGTIPYADADMGVQPKDSWSRNLKYEINSNLYTDRTTTCLTLRSTSPLSGNPEVIDADGTGTAFPVAAVIVSAGPMDADSDGDVFDNVTTVPYTGNNITGNPNYIRRTPTTAAGDEFDDMVTYIGKNELSGKICKYPVLKVDNNSGSTVYVYNQTELRDIDSVTVSDGTKSFYIVPGTSIEIYNALGGPPATVIPSTTSPLTPEPGESRTITIP